VKENKNMLILLTILFLVLLIVAANKDWDSAGIFYIIGFGVCLVVIVVLSWNIISSRTLESKIDMYTEENKNIEEDMNILVEQYMNYESNTYGNLKNESSIALVALYPELKADTLVEKQIEVYTENNKKIRELKEKTINIRNYKWLLYFGG